LKIVPLTSAESVTKKKKNAPTRRFTAVNACFHQER
jgi:hypothetical protein